MKLDIEVLSRDLIPPSSSTPDHLKTYKLSSLDQVHLPVLISRVLFYPSDNNQISNFDRSSQLKKSLSQVLTLFYPCAGRFVDNSYINCNDEGVAFVEAHANCNLLDFLKDPTPQEFTKFVPYDDDLKDHSLVIQATFFECGGMAIGVGISHRIGDAWSFFMFVNSWAATSRGNPDDIVSPLFDCPNLFPPPKDSISFKPKHWDVKEEGIVTKRFVFSSEKLSAIRDKYAKKSKDGEAPSRPPTRIEALSTFIWARFVDSTEEKDGTSKMYNIKHTINLRTKVSPPLPDNAFGNVMWVANSFVQSSGDVEEGTSIGLVGKIREAIQKVGGDRTTTLQELNGVLTSIKDGAQKLPEDGVVPLVFSSTCRFPIDKSDFGWGKPVWVGSANLPHLNVVYLLDSFSGKGIEAWVNLKSEDMAKFEVDAELLAYASIGHDVNV